MLYPKKNLIDIKQQNIEQGTIDGTGAWFDSTQRVRYMYFAAVKPNTDYTFSLQDIDLTYWNWAYVEYNDKSKAGGTAQTYNSGWLTSSSVTKKTTATTFFIGIVLRQKDNVNITPSMLPVFKMQLEEGSTATPFEPYQLGNKKAALVPKKNMIQPFDKLPLAVGETLVDSKTIKLVAPTTANIATDIVIPLQPGKTYTFSAINDNGSRIQLRKNDSTLYGVNITGNGSKQSITFVAIEEQVTIRRYNNGIAGTFIFSEFQLEEGSTATPFEPHQLRNKKAVLQNGKNKPAALVPKKNILKPFTESSWQLSKGTDGDIKVISGTKIEMKFVTNQVFASLYFPVKPNTLYTLSAKNPAKMGVYLSNRTTPVTGYTSEQKVTFNSGNNIELLLYLSVHSLASGTYLFEDVQIEEGVGTQFEPYRLGNKPAVLYPQQNLIPDFSKWTLNAKATIAAPYELLLNPIAPWTSSNVVVDVKPNTLYTFTRENASGIVYCSELDSNGTQVKSTNTSNATSLEITTLPNTAKIRVIYDNGNTSSGAFSLVKPQLKEGKAAPFEPYRLGNKRA